jgi:hypothetical protein
LEGSWETANLLKEVIRQAHRPNDKIIFDSDPKKLVERLIKMVLDSKSKPPMVYDNNDIRYTNGEVKKMEVIL